MIELYSYRFDRMRALIFTTFGEYHGKVPGAPGIRENQLSFKCNWNPLLWVTFLLRFSIFLRFCLYLSIEAEFDMGFVSSNESTFLSFVFCICIGLYFLHVGLFSFRICISIFCISCIVRLFYQCGGICGSQFQTETHTGLRAFPSQLQLCSADQHCNLLLAFAFQDFWVCVVS